MKELTLLSTDSFMWNSPKYICIYAAMLRHNEISEGGVSALKPHSLAYVD